MYVRAEGKVKTSKCDGNVTIRKAFVVLTAVKLHRSFVCI